MDIIDGSGFWEGGEITPTPVVTTGPGGYEYPGDDAWNREIARRWREALEAKAIQDDDEEFILTHLNKVEEEVSV